jgi:hypothetical protein
MSVDFTSRGYHIPITEFHMLQCFNNLSKGQMCSTHELM